MDTCVGNDKSTQHPVLEHAAGLVPRRHDRRRAFRRSRSTRWCVRTCTTTTSGGTRHSSTASWVPTFPNARYLLARTEWEHALERIRIPDTTTVLADSVRPIFDAGLVDLVDVPATAIGRHRARADTGSHTGAHVAVSVRSARRARRDHRRHDAPSRRRSHIRSGGHRSITIRTWPYDTRLAFLDEHADTPTLVIGTHFAGPTVGHIVRDGSTYRFDV